MSPLDLPLDVLVVAPHPDDAEISVGGLLVTVKRQGLRTGVIDLTNGEPTPHGSPEIRSLETSAATQILQLDWRDNLGLPNRSLQHTLEARRQLAGIFRGTRPKILLLPYWEDAHPDHVAACELAEAARFWAKLTRTDLPGDPFHPPTVYYYWSIHLRIHPQPALVLDISDAIEDKMRAIRCYESQFLVGRSQEFPTPLDNIRDRARYWGWAIQTRYAEPLGSREPLGVKSFREFVSPG